MLVESLNDGLLLRFKYFMLVDKVFELEVVIIWM